MIICADICVADFIYLWHINHIIITFLNGCDKLNWLTYINDVFQYTLNIIYSISIFDILDIIFIAYLIYRSMKLIKETRAEQLIKGIVILLFIFLFAQQFNLRVINFILENFFQVGIIAIIVMFQPEFRRILEKVGRTKVSTIAKNFDNSIPYDAEMLDDTIKIIVNSCINLSDSATGALIVLERTVKLGEFIERGTTINADPSVALFGNIFFNKAPLHDGALIMRNGKIFAAACTLPITSNIDYFNKGFGTRHKAAIGISECSDAIAIVVSEETGRISVAENGVLKRDYNASQLTNLLKQRLLTIPTGKQRIKKPRPEKKLKDRKDDKEAKQ